MKNLVKTSVCAVLAVILVLGLTACGNSVAKKGVWENATYLEDTTFGEGKNTVVVEVKAEEQSVKLTVNTDAEMVGDALLEHNLIEGEESQFGLYVKKVNGITADFDTDKAYWAFYVDGQYATKGIDLTEITKGTEYLLEYTK